MGAKNRDERLNFLIKKLGFKNVQHVMLFATDRYVKKYYEAMYPLLKDRQDAVEKEVECSRCGCSVIWTSNCGCGENRAVFDEEDWLDDIKGNDRLLPGDIEFLESIKKGDV